MRVGFIGAQGVGKTTLAKSMNIRMGYPIVETNTTKVFKDMGLKPDEVLDFESRIEIQNKIIDAAIDAWSKETYYVTDRTPLDMLAYTMVDINSSTRLTKSELEAFKDYRNRCIKATHRHFDLILLVQPGIDATRQDKMRASLDPALVDKMNIIMKGLLPEAAPVMTSIIPVDALSIRDRMTYVSAFAMNLIGHFTTESFESVLH